MQNNVLGIEEDQALMKQRKYLQKKADVSVAQSETAIIKRVRPYILCCIYFLTNFYKFVVDIFIIAYLFSR